MRSIVYVKQRILSGLGASLTIATGLACAGNGGPDTDAGGSAGAGGNGTPDASTDATGGSGASTGGNGGATGGSGGSATGTGGATDDGGTTTGTGGATGGAGGTTGGSGGAGGSLSDAACPLHDGGTTPACFGTSVCFTVAHISAYASIRDAGPDACACPELDDFYQRNFCGQVLVGFKGIVGGQCCYYLPSADSGPIEGRPFIVDGRQRQAGVIERGDWCAFRAREADAPLEPAQRARLAEAWLADATIEHASIASFARLTLQLLSLGAPPDLLIATQQATKEEIDHSRLCFGLASRYAQRPLGPSTLSVDRAVMDVTLTELAVAAVQEGCVGETLAAVLAAERLELARDPEVCTALAQIAEDETRHAALAWRTVIWAIARGGPPVHEAVRAAFDDAVAQYEASGYRAGEASGETDEADDLLLAHGRMPTARIRGLERIVMKEIVAPIASTLGSLVRESTEQSAQQHRAGSTLVA